MKRVVLLGRGGAGKSTLARQLGQITGLPVFELDKIFWKPGLLAMPRDEWVQVQRKVIGEAEWILDGDLGPYDAVEVRVQAADTIILLDFSFARCAWRAFRRPRDWLFHYRRQSRPALLRAIREHARGSALHILRNPDEVGRFVAGMQK